MRIGLYGGALLLSLALLLPGAARAADGRPFLLVGLDGKTFFRPEGSVNGPNGGDGLAVIDIADPARPRLAHVVGLTPPSTGRRPTCRSRRTAASASSPAP